MSLILMIFVAEKKKQEKRFSRERSERAAALAAVPRAVGEWFFGFEPVL